MICSRCKRENAQNARNCIYCGSPLYDSSNGNKNGRTTESVIVVLIIVLVLLLATVLGIYIYGNTKKSSSFNGGGGGSGSFVFKQGNNQKKKPAQGEPSPTPTAEIESEEDMILAQKEEFLRIASEIEQYAEEHLETANDQKEIDSESEFIYAQWDELLNGVYQYLEKIMPEEKFELLQKEEIQWIKEKEEAIVQVGEEWKDDAGEVAAMNMVGIEYTSERCYYLINLIQCEY